MTRLTEFFLLALAITALASGSASATTIGSVAPSPSTGDDCTVADCTYVQESSHAGGPSYVVPFNGVATSFTLQLGNAVFYPFDKVRFYTFERISAGAFRASADSGPISLPNGSSTQVVTLPIRQKVVAGQLLGLGLDLSGTTFGQFTPAGFQALDSVIEFAGFPELGQLGTYASDTNGKHLNVRAVVEPDADNDGYGDETQDGCPTDRSDQGPCTAPVISDFKYSLNKFAVEKTGSVLQPAATAQGTTVIIALSKAARVSFEMSLKTAGRKVGKSCKKQTRKNRKRKKCTRYGRPYKFARDLPQGTSNLGFSGRIKVGSKTVSLPAGKYRATAAPFSVASNLAGSTASASFRVVEPKKKR